MPATTIFEVKFPSTLSVAVAPGSVKVPPTFTCIAALPLSVTTGGVVSAGAGVAVGVEVAVVVVLGDELVELAAGVEVEVVFEVAVDGELVGVEVAVVVVLGDEPVELAAGVEVEVVFEVAVDGELAVDDIVIVVVVVGGGVVPLLTITLGPVSVVVAVLVANWPSV